MKLKAIAIVSTLTALLAGPLVAQDRTAVLSPQQMAALGAALLDDGKAQEADAIASLLLQRDPNDIGGLIIGARAAIAQNNPDQAIALARRAYWRTDDKAALFAAARLAANGHAALEQDTRSQLWLRRAAQYAPNEQAMEAIGRDYQFLRQRNPFSTSLRFGITPTQNLNNGSSSDTQLGYLFGGIPVITTLDAEAQALSGLEFSGGISTRYRINATQTAATFFDLSLSGRTFALSRESQDRIAEDTPEGETPTRGSDFSDASLTLGLTHRRILQDGWRPTSVGLAVTRQKSWYNDEPLRHIYSLSLGHEWQIGEADVVSATVIGRKRTNVVDDPPVRSVQLDGSWRRRLDNGDQVSFGGGWTQSNSDSFDNDYQSLSLRAGYDFGESVNGMRFGIGLSGYLREWQDYPIFSLDGRTDRSVTASLRVTFEEIEFYGFQPVATLEASRSRSNVDRFDTDGLRLGFDLQSSF